MSPTRVHLVFVGLPIPYRRGIERAATDADAASDDGIVVALTTLDRNPDTCARIDQLVAETDRVVCLLQPLDINGIAHAFSHRAYFAEFDSEPEQVLRAALAAAGSVVEIPFVLAEELVGADPHSTVELSDEESAWLVALAAGATVVKVADEFGYSERVLFRRLHEIYTRLGVSNRAEALIAAERRRLLRRPTD